jgi:hypothetical protein
MARRREEAFIVRNGNQGVELCTKACGAVPGLKGRDIRAAFIVRFIPRTTSFPENTLDSRAEARGVSRAQSIRELLDSASQCNTSSRHCRGWCDQAGVRGRSAPSEGRANNHIAVKGYITDSPSWRRSRPKPWGLASPERRITARVPDSRE